jgi:hypothetical protein
VIFQGVTCKSMWRREKRMGKKWTSMKLDGITKLAPPRYEKDAETNQMMQWKHDHQSYSQALPESGWHVARVNNFVLFF